MAEGVTVGSLPADSEQFMLIEELYKQTDKLQIRVDSMLHNEVGIKALDKAVDKLQKDVEKLKDKIVGLALVALITLVGWNLKETWTMKEQVFKLQQGQIFLSKQIKKNSNLIKRNIKKPNKKKKNKKKKQQDE